MSSADMDISVGGNVSGGVSALKSVQSELAKTAVAAAKTDSAITKASASLNNNLKTGANQATNAMTNLGRVIQDAPFGIIGITNNINPLLESFQRLKAETGSTGTALKALAGSLIGAGGLGLAVSIVTSLLTVFALNSRSSASATEEHKTKIDATKKAAEDYSDAIGRASSAVLGHQGKLVELNKALRNTSNEFNFLSKNIINQALAQYLATEKEGLVKKIIDAKTKQILALNKINNPFSDVKEYSPDLFSKDPLKKAVAEAEADLKNLNNIVKSLGITDIFEKIFSLDKVKPIKAEDLERMKLWDNIQNIKVPERLKLNPDVSIIPNVKEIVVTAKQQDRILKGFQKLLDEAKLRALMEDFQVRVKTMISDTFSNTITGIGEAIGNAFAGGKNIIPNLFGGLMTSLGSQVQELGKFLIKSAITIKIAKEAFKKLLANPIAAAAVGVGLVALGALLKAQAAKQYQGFATGSRSTPGGVFDVGERGRERIFLPQGSRVQPNNELNAYGGGNIVLQPSIQYSGAGFRIMLNRVDQQFGRNN